MIDSYEINYFSVLINTEVAYSNEKRVKLIISYHLSMRKIVTRVVIHSNNHNTERWVGTSAFLVSFFQKIATIGKKGK